MNNLRLINNNINNRIKSMSFNPISHRTLTQSIINSNVIFIGIWSRNLLFRFAVDLSECHSFFCPCYWKHIVIHLSLLKCFQLFVVSWSWLCFVFFYLFVSTIFIVWVLFLYFCNFTSTFDQLVTYIFKMSWAWCYERLPFRFFDEAAYFFWFCPWNCFLFYSIYQRLHCILTWSWLRPLFIFYNNRFCECCSWLLHPKSSPWEYFRPIIMRMARHHFPFILIYIKINKSTFFIFHLNNILNFIKRFNVHIIFNCIIFHSKFRLY